MIEELDPPAPVSPHSISTSGAGALVAAPPSVRCTACVVIPARDEATSIERTLASLSAQRTVDGRPLDPTSYEIILVANNCRDETAAVARRLAERNRAPTLHVVELELPSEQAHVGSARRLGMDEACHRLLSLGQPRGIIATTDADTIVAPTWLAATLHEAAGGAEAVGGRILVAEADRRAMAPAVRSRYLRNVGYWALADEVMARVDPSSLDPSPRHEQFFGASVAITARAYREVGGLPPLSSGEDAALAAALLRADIGIRHSPSVRVYTSGRLDGRTPGGLAASLAAWSGLSLDGRFQLVPGAADVVARAAMRRALRDLWRRARSCRALCPGEVSVLAGLAQVSEAWLSHAILDAERFGVLLYDFEEYAGRRCPPELVDIREAIAGLRLWLAPYRRPGVVPPVLARRRAGLPFVPPTRRAVHLTGPPERQLRSAPLEPDTSVAERTSPLTPPPQVA
jgi:hypothetical protein